MQLMVTFFLPSFEQRDWRSAGGFNTVSAVGFFRRLYKNARMMW